jgi:hypothetical protein
MFLIDDILLSPLKGLIWLGNKINEVAEREVSDEGRVKEQLMELQLKFELDEITEEEYTEQEKQLLARLESMRSPAEEEVQDGKY